MTGARHCKHRTAGWQGEGGAVSVPNYLAGRSSVVESGRARRRTRGRGGRRGGTRLNAASPPAPLSRRYTLASPLSSRPHPARVSNRLLYCDDHTVQYGSGLGSGLCNSANEISRALIYCALRSTTEIARRSSALTLTGSVTGLCLRCTRDLTRRGVCSEACAASAPELRAYPIGEVRDSRPWAAVRACGIRRGPR